MKINCLFPCQSEQVGSTVVLDTQGRNLKRAFLSVWIVTETPDVIKSASGSEGD